jgi:hypothetical protein
MAQPAPTKECSNGGRKHTGLKHNHCNKCQLNSQKQVYDALPYILIVPIMDLAEVKGWVGEEYKVLVLMNNTETHGQVLLHCQDSENFEEVDKALLLLKNFTFWNGEK